MENNAYTLLGVRDFASLEEIEEAYRNKKQLYDPGRFVKGTSDWEFAYTRNEALDRAYAEAVSACFVLRRESVAPDRSIRAPADRERRWDEGHVSPSGGLIVLLMVYPIAACLMQLPVPAILFDLAPGGIRIRSLFPVAFLTILSYSFPLFLRFVLLRRAVRSFGTALFLFPATLLTADLFASVLLSFSFVLPIRGFRYVPVFYATGWGPLFLVFCAHCAILRVQRFGSWKVVSPLRRLTLQTFTLFLSVALSMGVCALGNREKGAAAASAVSSLSASSFSASPVGGEPGKPWLSLELFDAGTLEIPGTWYVEDSNGTDRRMDHGQVVQHVREALVARPYGQRESGPDFAFEVLVYRWTRRNGSALPPPGGIVDRVQEHQFEALRGAYSDIVSSDRTESEYGGYFVSMMTVETRFVPGYVLRFKNLAFERDDKLYCLTVGYPADEEEVWTTVLKDILERWRL